jgi:hypothetical protein
MSDEDKPSRLQPGHGVPLSPRHVSRPLLVVTSPVCPLSTKRAFYPGCLGEMISGFPIWFIVQTVQAEVGDKDKIRRSHVYRCTVGMLHIPGRLFTFARRLIFSKAQLVCIWNILIIFTERFIMLSVITNFFTRKRRPGSTRAGRFGDRIPMRARFSAPVQTCPGAHPAYCTISNGSFPGVEFGRGVTLTPHPILVPRSKDGVALYLCSP